MSETEAAVLHLCRERSYLKTWSRSVDNMLGETPRESQRHWELVAERDSLQKEMQRVTRRLRYFK